MDQLVIERTPRGRVRGGGPGVEPTPATSSVAPGATARAVPVRARQWRTVGAVWAGVALVLLAAAWSVLHGWGRGPVPGPGELALGDGLVRVDAVVSAARPQHAMPGMGTDEDPVAAGDRRVSVDVTLLAGAGPLEYAADRFALAVDGAAADPLPHRAVLPGDVLPAGTQLSGTLVFDVPVDATSATLSYRGAGSTDVALPPEASGPAGADPSSAGGHDLAGHGPAQGDSAGDDAAGDDAAGDGPVPAGDLPAEVAADPEEGR
ncbi:hypothetical protein [uncultured Cellulomonas sp.]|uniref:hypothetical protein n=1 Tax=uncultured Cellulomonas sp. TaxID=189682 RepID=UPI002603EABA|nr:hypothetical protein [uncultured Cellulomonas sp.]